MVERTGFDEFVAARTAALLRLSYLLTRDRALAEDLLQTALARSWRAWGRIDGDPEPYVRAVVVRTYCSRWRARRRGEVRTEVLPETDTAGTDSELLWQAIGQLPRRQRAVVVLRYYEDLQEMEIAAVLGVSAGTVQSRCRQALAQLGVDPPALAEGPVDITPERT